MLTPGRVKTRKQQVVDWRATMKIPSYFIKFGEGKYTYIPKYVS